MARWEQDFDFYMAMVDGKPASFVLDLAAASHAPVATHPLLLEIRVPLLQARVDGLRDQAELEPLGALEDQFVAALEQKVDAIYAGRVVHDGATSLYLYVAEAHRDALEALPALTGDPPGEYVPEWAVASDPDWGHYLEFLAPDSYSRQSIMNRRLLAIFTENGDALDVARPVDHLAYFPGREGAEQAASALRSAGFTTDELEAAADDRGWGLQFHRADALSDGRPDEFVEEILDVILPLEGDYDGWGAEHRAPAAG
jgi:hypothetical protein